MIYPIVIYGSDVLRKPCERITPDYPEVKKLVEDMFLTLGEAEGVGLAAPQIGKNIRLFIVDCTPWGEDDPECADYKRAFINPEIYALSEEKEDLQRGMPLVPRHPCRRAPARWRSGCVIWTRISSSTTRSSTG